MLLLRQLLLLLLLILLQVLLMLLILLKLLLVLPPQLTVLLLLLLLLSNRQPRAAVCNTHTVHTDQIWEIDCIYATHGSASGRILRGTSLGQPGLPPHPLLPLAFAAWLPCKSRYCH